LGGSQTLPNLFQSPSIHTSIKDRSFISDFIEDLVEDQAINNCMFIAKLSSSPAMSG
jgi:hypothetical protein